MQDEAIILTDSTFSLGALADMLLPLAPVPVALVPVALVPVALVPVALVPVALVPVEADAVAPAPAVPAVPLVPADALASFARSRHPLTVTLESLDAAR